MAEKQLVRKRYTFTGGVQGVGFRYRAVHAASLCGCTGWVRNELDGTVTMEIQGTPLQIETVIASIEQGRYVRIERMRVSSIPLEQGECTFGWD